NDYVARFIQDVDRSRVMTAEAILERPAETLGEDHGPRTAHRMLRESQNSWLIALNRDRTPRGVLWEDDVAEAVSRGQDQLPWVPGREMLGRASCRERGWSAVGAGARYSGGR